MKPWRDLSQVKMPPNLEVRPRDARGYPIPYAVAERVDGTFDFRVIDPAKSSQCLVLRLCSLCGRRMYENNPLAFLGGPRSAQLRLYTDGAMHVECAEYACQVCPFIAAPKFAYAKDIPGMVTAEITAAMSLHRPEGFVLYIANEYAPVTYMGSEISFAGPCVGGQVWIKSERVLNWEGPLPLAYLRELFPASFKEPGEQQ